MSTADKVRIGLVVAQAVCLIIGTVQGIRYRKTEPFFKSFPWLAPAIFIGPIVQLISKVWP